MLEAPQLLIENIIDKVRKSNNLTEQKVLISSLLLVLPEIPEEAPDWLTKFEQFQLKPKRSTLTLLIDSLSDAFPVSFMKLKSAANPIPVIIDASNPDALPIAPHYLRSEIAKIHEQWYSESGLATAKLEKNGILDLPHEGTLYTVFTLGFFETGILQSGQRFKGQRVWAFVAKALNVPKNGNTLPFWFLVKNTGDISQLKAQLNKAKRVANQTLKNNITNVIIGIESIENKVSIDKNNPFYKKLLELDAVFINNLDKIQKYKNTTLKYALDGEYIDSLTKVIEGELNVGELLNDILSNDSLNIDFKKYWSSTLCSLCTEIEDTPALLSVLNDPELIPAHTWARKAFRNIDFRLNGPNTE